MSFFAITSVTSAAPTASTGTVTFDVADPSRLPPVPFSAWHYPQLRNDSSGITRSKQAQLITVSAVSGSTVTATLAAAGTTGHAVSFGDVIDVSVTVMPGLQTIRSDGAVSAASSVPNLLHMVEGSPASPVLDRGTSTVVMYRYSNMMHGVAASFTATISQAAPGVFTATAHKLQVNDTLELTTSGSLPAGLSISVVYYVVSRTANTFTVSATPHGTPITTSSAGSGTHTVFPLPDDANAVLWVEHTNDGLVQPVAIHGSATQLGAGDTCAAYFVGDGRGAGAVYAGFFLASWVATSKANYAGFALNPVQVNNSNLNWAYDGSTTVGPAGVFIQALAGAATSGAKTSGTGITIFANDPTLTLFDVGIGFWAGAVKTATLRDDSSSVTVFDVNGSHTNLLDFSGATVSNAYILFDANFKISFSVGDPLIQFDSGDFIVYGRTGNTLAVLIGGTTRGYWASDGLHIPAGHVIHLDGGSDYTNPDYVFEMWRDGAITKHAGKRGAADFEPRDLRQMEAYVRENLHLPAMHRGEPMDVSWRFDALLEELEQAYIYIFEQERRLVALEAA